MNAINILLGAFTALMILGGAAMATDSVVTATVTPGIEVSATSRALIFNVGPNDVTVPGAVQVDVNTDHWTLSAKAGNGAGSDGYFYSASTRHFLGYPRPGPLSLKVDTLSSEYYGFGPVAMDTLKTIASGYNTVGGSYSMPVHFIQSVGGAEPAVNDYKMTVVYTGSTTW
jgi:hypothetical protein